MKELVLVLDFGSPHRELIASKIRNLSVYAEILPGESSIEKIIDRNPIGIVILGETTTGFNSLKIPTIKFSDAEITGQIDSLDEILNHFLFNTCSALGDYKVEDYIDTQIAEIRQAVGKEKVLLALSGGVDSSVCAALLSKAIPGQLKCVFVDHGLLRLNEGDEVEEAFADHDLELIRINAQDRFLAKLKDVTDPEHKRKIIGEEFIRIFEEEAKKLDQIPFLAQGTIYPDIVESGGEFGAIIKSHHNVGGLPENLDFDKIIEPLSGLFKNEVRRVGRILGLSAALVDRQPFPGPGLAVRVMGNVTFPKLEIVRQADAIVREELDKLDPRPSQYFAVLTDTYSVGIKNGARTYHPVVAIRAVTSKDFMTATATPISHDVLSLMAMRIASEVEGVSRVVYDISPKPPGTVEWQ